MEGPGCFTQTFGECDHGKIKQSPRLQNLLEGRAWGGGCFPRGLIKSLYTSFMCPSFPWPALVISLYSVLVAGTRLLGLWTRTPNMRNWSRALGLRKQELQGTVKDMTRSTLG